MGKFDHYTWEEREDFSYIRELEIPKELMLDIYIKLMKAVGAEGF